MGTFSTTAKNQMLDKICSGGTVTFAGAVYGKLHIGDPGTAGTANPAGETTRHQVTVGSASSGVVTSTADLTWTSVSTAETITWMSFWDAVSSGNFIGKDDLPASKTVAVGDTLTVASGNITLAI